MSVGKYFPRHNVPFSIAQYYRYKKKLEHGGPDAIKDNRSKGNNRKLVTEAEGFLKGYLRSRPEVGLAELQDLLKERFKIRMSKSGVSKCLNRLGCVCQMKPVEEKVERSYTVSGGFELIIALAFHLGWPQAVAEVISNRIEQIKQSNLWLEGEKGKISQVETNRANLLQNIIKAKMCGLNVLTLSKINEKERIFKA